MHYPYAEIELRSDGSPADPGQVDAAVALVADSGATDVLVMVHGWNNDLPAARSLYERLAASLTAADQWTGALDGRSLVVIGILWPSIRWADDGRVAGGGAAVADPGAELAAQITDRIDDEQVRTRLLRLVGELESSSDARQQYLDLLRGLIPAAVDGDEDPPPTGFTDDDPDAVFAAARSAGGLSGAPASGGAAVGGAIGGPGAGGGAAGGGAAGLSMGGFLDAARNLLNLTTYYTMKARAGTVGSTGIARALEAVHAGAPSARLHLVGHSFGARAVTAAAMSTTAPVHSVSLLQGAFSHYALSDDYDGRGSDGSFRPVLARLEGPMIITHTRNDRAVGLAYAIASRLARQSASAIGDAADPYGGMGSNGAQRTPEVLSGGRLLDVGGAYQFAPGRVSNLLADEFVSGHSDVANEQVANAILAAIVVPSA